MFLDVLYGIFLFAVFRPSRGFLVVAQHFLQLHKCYCAVEFLAYQDKGYRYWYPSDGMKVIEWAIAQRIPMRVDETSAFGTSYKVYNGNTVMDRDTHETNAISASKSIPVFSASMLISWNTDSIFCDESVSHLQRVSLI